MAVVSLFYLSPNTTGGWVTYTSHLIETLQSQGVEVRLYKVGNRTEKNFRSFGYDKRYRNLSLEDACSETLMGTALIVAGAKKFKRQTEELWDCGAKIVVHDPTEIKNLPAVHERQKDVVVIRRVALKTLPDATFIRHPYVRRERSQHVQRSGLCVSVSRIDFDKKTNILLDANRFLERRGCEPIQIRGFENRLYTKFKIIPEYPEWEQSVAAYPREAGAAFDILRSARYMADMSVIKGDGGGTQYTTLEAWDAGTVPIINKEWLLSDEDDMVPEGNCYAVSDGQELGEFLMEEKHRMIANPDVLDSMEKSIGRHHPDLIGPQYLEFLGV